jgi:hypothetical protein
MWESIHQGGLRIRDRRLPGQKSRVSLGLSFCPGLWFGWWLVRRSLPTRTVLLLPLTDTLTCQRLSFNFFSVFCSVFRLFNL